METGIPRQWLDMLRKASAEAHPSGRVIHHISGGQLSAFQVGSAIFGDLYLKRKTQ